VADKAWKQFERRVAKFFGCRRNPLSGRNGGHSCSDTLHKDLYIECKQSKRHAVITLWNQAKWEASRYKKDNKKIPVVCLSEKNRPGFWVMCHSSDLKEVVDKIKV